MDIIIDENYHNSRIDRFIRDKFNIPQSLVSKLIRDKKIKINKQKVEISTKLQNGDIVNIYYFFEEKSIAVQISQKIIDEFKTWIIFEDENIIIINKPNGISSQGGSNAGFGIDEIAKGYNKEARIVHRLDRETSGVMIITKNKLTARNITKLFADSKIEKIYYAIVENKSNDFKHSGYIEGDLVKDIKFQKMVLIEGTSDVKTYYEVLKKNQDYILLKVIPKTGKMHQIRVHLASIGYPIIGDKKYNGKPFNRMMLHAYSIKFDEKIFTVLNENFDF